eukprot:gene12742-15991_t
MPPSQDVFIPDDVLSCIFSHYEMDARQLGPGATALNNNGFPWAVSKRTLRLIGPEMPRLLRTRHDTIDSVVSHHVTGNAVMLSQFVVTSQEVGGRRVVDEDLLELFLSHRNVVSDEMRTAFYGVVPSDSRAGPRAELRHGIVGGAMGTEHIAFHGGAAVRFMCAIENADTPLVTSMLADVEVREALGLICRRGDALIGACQVGNVAIVELLLEHRELGARANCQYNSPILHAREGGHESVVERLLADTKFPANPDTRTPLGRLCKRTVNREEKREASHRAVALFAACRQGDVTLVGELLETGLNPPRADDEDHEALIIACGLGYVGVVERLLRPGDNAALAHARNYLGFALASRGGHEPVVRLLLGKGVPANSANSAAVWHASAGGHIGIVRLLLLQVDQPAEADNSWHEGCSPLHVASQKGHVGVVQLLVDELSKTGEHEYRYKTCLQAACGAGHEGVVCVLLKVSTADEQSLTAARSRGNARIVARLIRRGFKFRSQDCSALWYACRYGFVNTAKMLLQIQDVMRYDRASHQRSLLETASARGHHQVVSLLLTHYQNTQDDVGAAVVASVKRGAVETVRLLKTVVEPSATWEVYRSTAILHATGIEMLELL